VPANRCIISLNDVATRRSKPAQPHYKVFLNGGRSDKCAQLNSARR
jgi:hypothetical protein